LIGAASTRTPMPLSGTIGKTHARVTIQSLSLHSAAGHENFWLLIVAGRLQVLVRRAAQTSSSGTPSLCSQSAPDALVRDGAHSLTWLQALAEMRWLTEETGPLRWRHPDASQGRSIGRCRDRYVKKINTPVGQACRRLSIAGYHRNGGYQRLPEA